MHDVLKTLHLLEVILPRLGRPASGFSGDSSIPDSYRKESASWLVWGVIATIPLVVAVYPMVAKPEF